MQSGFAMWKVLFSYVMESVTGSCDDVNFTDLMSSMMLIEMLVHDGTAA